MLSFQGQYTQCQDLSQDNGADALTFFKTNLNLGQHNLETELGSFFTEETYTDLTEANVFSYPNPDQFVRLKMAYVTISNTRYIMEQVYDEDRWQAIQAAQVTQTSTIPTHIFVRRDTYEIYPTPSTASKVITLIYEASGKDLQFADYTEGTIVSIANGALAVVGSGTTWTTAMAKRFLKIGIFPVWYKIASVQSATTLTLEKPYQGLTIAAATEPYRIGELPRTPESTHQIPIWYALMNYFGGFKQNETKLATYKSLYESDLKTAKKTYGKRYSSNYIPGNRRRAAPVNPNNYPTNMTT